MTNEPYAMQSPFLVVEIACGIPGPQLGSDEKTALDKLYEHAEKVGELLFAGHDPDGYQMWLDSQNGPQRSFNDLVTNPAPAHAPVAEVIPIRSGQSNGRDPVRFGQGLQRLRKEHGMSRMQLKVLSGLGNYPYLAELESGARYPSEEAMGKLAKAFEMGPVEFEQLCLHPAPVV